MIKNLKVCVFTSCRAEYGLLKWVMQEIKENKNMDLRIIATGAHFSEKYGLTYKEIENDSFKIDYKIICNFELDNDLERLNEMAKLLL